MRRVLFVVAYRDLVDGFAQACKQAGLRLVGIDLEAFALLRALTPFAELAGEDGERSALVAVSIGSERSTLAVSDGITCEFTRVLDWGGAALTAAIARELGIELDRGRGAQALAGPRRDRDSRGRRRGAGREGAERPFSLNLQSFARELVSSLQFYQGQPGSLGIREVVLAGGTANLQGFAEALSRWSP